MHVFHGTKDAVVPYESGKKLAMAIERATLTTIEGGNHHNLRDYEEYHRVLRQLLKK